MNLKNIKISILFLFYILSSNAQISQAEVDKIVKAEMIRQNLPGLAIGVYQKGKIDYTQGYGHLDINRTKPITKKTVFRWASISKVLTAVAVLKLDEEHTDFSINDSVIKHYPHWTAKVWDKPTYNLYKNKLLTSRTKRGYMETPDITRKEKITIEHLLTHRSGINHYSKGLAKTKGEFEYHKKSYKSDSDHFNADESVNVFRRAKLDFDPGSNFLYSTFGFNLLGAVVDKETGSYTKWVEKNIKNKLGMTSLRVARGSAVGFNKPIDGRLKDGNVLSKEWVLPGGGWESNVIDLLKFAKGIAKGTLLNDTSKLWESTSNNNSSYKNGINSNDSKNKLGVWHGGTHKNLKTLMYVAPDQEIAVVVMIPVDEADIFNVMRGIVVRMGMPITPYKTSPVDICLDGMGSSSRKYFGVWRKTNEDVVIRRGYSNSNFKKEWEFLKSNGYYVDNIEFSNNLWNGIFKRGDASKYAMWRNYTFKEFNSKWKEMNNKGYRLYDLETYVVKGKRKWAGLFKKGSGKYAMYRDLSSSDFRTKKDLLAKQGQKLIDIEVYYNAKSGLKWSGVWVKGKDGSVFLNNDLADFKALVVKYRKSGYELIDIETYIYKGKRKWTGVLEKSTLLGFQNEPEDYCLFMTTHETQSKNNFELIDYVSY